MTKTISGKETFISPAFGSRLKSMLKLDFYRLFHTSAFYIMLFIAAIIPAMILSTSGADTSEATIDNSSEVVSSTIEVTNAWQLIESTGSSAAGANPLDFGGYANINMVFIFAGLLMAIFVAHDYSSGFVKNIFTVHSKKIDYVISKSVAGIFGGVGMIITYVLGAVIAGLLTGKAFDVNMSGLILCLISKICLMGVFCSLFLSISVFFRSKLWLAIVFTFLLGMMFYPAASIATLGSTIITLLISLIVGTAGAVAIGAVSTLVLKKRDLA